MDSSILSQIIPFRYLDPDQRAAIQAELEEHVFEPGQVLVEQHDTRDKRLFILQEGSVEVFAGGAAEPIGRITAGHYFGERACLFDEPRRVQVRAADRVRAYSLTAERFLTLIGQSRPFAQSLAKILRDKQGLFVAFDRFLAELVGRVAKGRIELQELLPMYQKLEPALHSGAVHPQSIDFAALTYAVRRLPDNLTRTFTYFIAETLPIRYSEPDLSFTSVSTRSRRRAIYEMMPGKNMVLIRDGISDLVDLITCLCLYVIEARKIRHRLADPALMRAMRDPKFDRLPLSADELHNLEVLWPGQVVPRLREIALHHEDLRIEVFKDLHNYNSAHSETWSSQVARATQDLLDRDPSDLPDGVGVHILSSNTHSAVNCLSVWLAENGSKILAWARDQGHELLEETWENEGDAVYALARDYFRQHPDASMQKDKQDREAGIAKMSETAFTGIGVQLIDSARLVGHSIDSGVTQPSAGSRDLIVNIDYAFGQQAEHIVANLLALFGRRVKSVNVLGKAGGLQGKRGDVMLPDALIDQTGDRFLSIPLSSATVNQARLQKRIPDRGLHRGTVLTVAGTLLQNRSMLQYNRHLWGCVGLEMEGSYYYTQIRESMDRGVVPSDIPLRFLYYTSDLPLDHDSNLSRKMRASEGVPALYAVTREILSAIFEQG